MRGEEAAVEAPAGARRLRAVADPEVDVDDDADLVDLEEDEYDPERRDDPAYLATILRENRPFQSWCGRVKAVPPKDRAYDPYWRLEFHEFGRRRQPRGGKTRASATNKVADCLARLDAGTSTNRDKRVGDLLDEWFRAGPGERPRGKQWSEGTQFSNEWYADRYIREHAGKVRAKDLDKRVYARILNAAPTAKEADQARRRLSGFLTWAHTADAISAQQKIDLAGVVYKPAGGALVRPSRREEVRVAGEVDEYLNPNDRIGFELMAALGDAMQNLYAHGKLYVELAAATGCRQSELFALTVDSVRGPGRRVCHVDWQVASKGRKRLLRPKGGKQRRTVIDDNDTGTGFDLLGALAERVEAVRVEQERGYNPRGLLLPAPRGNWWDESNLDNRVWSPGAEAAGVPVIVWTERDKNGQEVERRRWKYTTHSLRDRYAVSALDIWKWSPGELQIAGGWETADVIYKRYYGASDSALESMMNKTRRRT